MSTILTATIVIVFILSFFLYKKRKKTSKSLETILLEKGIKIRKKEPDDYSTLESWSSESIDYDIFGIEAMRSKDRWNWEIDFYFAEYLKKDQIFNEITDALTKVKGVEKVNHKDSAKWKLQANSKAEDIIKACLKVLLKNENEIRKYIYK